MFKNESHIFWYTQQVSRRKTFVNKYPIRAQNNNLFDERPVNKYLFGLRGHWFDKNNYLFEWIKNISVNQMNMCGYASDQLFFWVHIVWNYIIYPIYNYMNYILVCTNIRANFRPRLISEYSEHWFLSCCLNRGTVRDKNRLTHR